MQKLDSPTKSPVALAPTTPPPTKSTVDVRVVSTSVTMHMKLLTVPTKTQTSVGTMDLGPLIPVGGADRSLEEVPYYAMSDEEVLFASLAVHR
jgi:hypothetical protein